MYLGRQSSNIAFTPDMIPENSITRDMLKAGATSVNGPGKQQLFLESDVVVTEDYTIGQNAMVSGVTVTIATPAVFSLNDHGFFADQVIRFETTGALPTGLSADEKYYVLASGLTANSFNVSLTPGGTAVATTGTQSGTHSVGPVKNAAIAGGLAIATGKVLRIPTGSKLAILA